MHSKNSEPPRHAYFSHPARPSRPQFILRFPLRLSYFVIQCTTVAVHLNQTSRKGENVMTPQNARRDLILISTNHLCPICWRFLRNCKQHSAKQQVAAWLKLQLAANPPTPSPEPKKGTNKTARKSPSKPRRPALSKTNKTQEPERCQIVKHYDTT